MLLLGGFLGAAAVGSDDTLVYLAPSGRDDRTGTQPDGAVATLARAAEVARSALVKGRHVTILVASGTYSRQSLNLDGAVLGDAPLTIRAAGAERPVFDGEGAVSTWLVLRAAAGRPTRLDVEGLEIRNYLTAISLNGDRNRDDGWNGSVRIANNVFANIGSAYSTTGKISTAAIRFVNSRGNAIENNHFVGIRNRDRCGALHAVYVAHSSSDNRIVGNTFEDVCGAVIKVRDGSNDNLVARNQFSLSKGVFAFLDGFCDQGVRDDCTKPTQECPSWGNRFEENTVRGVGRDVDEYLRIVGRDQIAACQSRAESRVRLGPVIMR